MISPPNAAAYAREVLETVDVGVILVDADRSTRMWNAWMEGASGIARADALGRPIWSVLPDLAETRLPSAVQEALDIGASSLLSHTLNPGLLPLRLPDGRALLHSVVVRPLDAGPERLCLIQVSDVTAVAERERHLRERRDARYRAIVDTAQEAIVTTDVGGRIQWANRAAERRFGYDLAEMVGHGIELLLGPDAVHWPRDEAARSWTGTGAPLEVTGCRRDGSLIAVALSLGRWTSDGRSFLTGIMHDVTDRRRARQALERALDDKMMLLREVNHRVKNSLQLVSGLLSLQVAATDDDLVRRHLRDAALRIGAVAQVHQKLYRADSFRSLDFASFLQELCDDLAKGAGGAGAVDLTVEADPVELPVDLAVPLGLVANELVTNAIKHGASNPARVRVSLRMCDSWLALVVADHGRGVPPGFVPTRSAGLGMRIVCALTRQLSGTISVPETDVGARFEVAIPHPEAAMPDAQASDSGAR